MTDSPNVSPKTHVEDAELDLGTQHEQPSMLDVAAEIITDWERATPIYNGDEEMPHLESVVFVDESIDVEELCRTLGRTISGTAFNQPVGIGVRDNGDGRAVIMIGMTEDATPKDFKELQQHLKDCEIALDPASLDTTELLEGGAQSLLSAVEQLSESWQHAEPLLRDDGSKMLVGEYEFAKPNEFTSANTYQMMQMLHEGMLDNMNLQFIPTIAVNELGDGMMRLGLYFEDRDLQLPEGVEPQDLVNGDQLGRVTADQLITQFKQELPKLFPGLKSEIGKQLALARLDDYQAPDDMEQRRIRYSAAGLLLEALIRGEPELTETHDPEFEGRSLPTVIINDPRLDEATLEAAMEDLSAAIASTIENPLQRDVDHELGDDHSLKAHHAYEIGFEIDRDEEEDRTLHDGADPDEAEAAEQEPEMHIAFPHADEPENVIDSLIEHRDQLYMNLGKQVFGTHVERLQGESAGRDSHMIH